MLYNILLTFRIFLPFHDSSLLPNDISFISSSSFFSEPQFSMGLHNGSWRKSLLLAVLVLVLLCSAAAFYGRCWLPLALLCRDKFASLEENGNYFLCGLICSKLVCYFPSEFIIFKFKLIFKI
jgi:hypothetical protein